MFNSKEKNKTGTFSKREQIVALQDKDFKQLPEDA